MAGRRSPACFRPSLLFCLPWSACGPISKERLAGALADRSEGEHSPRHLQSSGLLLNRFFAFQHSFFFSGPAALLNCSLPLEPHHLVTSDHDAAGVAVIDTATAAAIAIAVIDFVIFALLRLACAMQDLSCISSFFPCRLSPTRS